MNKRTKLRTADLFAILGFKTKESREKLTNKDWNNFLAEYKKKYSITFQEDLEQPDDEDNAGGDGTQGSIENEIELSSDMQQEILEAIAEGANASGSEVPVEAPKNQTEAIQALMAITATLTNANRVLGSKPENGNPIEVVRASPNTVGTQMFATVMGHTAHTASHLFGIENDYFKRGNWWNDIVATGSGKSDYREEDTTAFRSAFNSYAKDFHARCVELASSNQIALLDYNKMVKGESYLDYSKMNTKLGEYVVRRMDMVIAYLRTLKSVAGIFPLVSNVQNKMTAPTAFFEELSQSYRSGRHFKGAVNFDGEIYHVDDVMFKFFFDDPKQLEKEYIGYQNREGSNPMKWTLFEWCIVHFGTLLFNEQQRRRVIGVKVPIQGEFPQPAMLAADGVLRAIQRVEEEYKVLPFEDLKVYDRTTIVDYVEEFYEKVLSILPNMEGYKLHINEKHKAWYVKGYREKYGKDNDFTGTKDVVADLSSDNIVWIPNMSMNDYKMCISQLGNIENYEDKPNEMYAFYFQQDLEQLMMASWWKEGSGVLAPGVQFNSLTDLKNSGRRMQWLFTNYPVVSMDADATVVDGFAGYEIETAANTKATALTNIENASIERVYKIICGSTTNATTIAKSGNFDGITATWTPAAVGDYIKVYAELKEEIQTIGGKQKKVVVHTGKFLELERKVS